MKQPFLKAVKQGGLVGDGAMGSQLYEHGIFVNRNFDEINLSQPEMVFRIHQQYVQAGAHIVQTNTYGANSIRLDRHGLLNKAEKINRQGVKLALRATQDAAYVFGGLGPSGLKSGEIRRRQSELVNSYAQQANWLCSAGVDGLIIETFLNPAELQIAIEAARSVTDKPIIAHITVDESGQISDGTEAIEIAHEIASWGANVIGANCHGPDTIYALTAAMAKSDLLISAMPNAGHPVHHEDRFICLATPENFGVFARRMFKAGVKLVGGCCGTGPEHIKRVAAAARMIVPHKYQATYLESIDTERQQPVPVAERSRFGQILGQRFVVSVEVNPPAGLDITSPLENAKMLLNSGADIINIADGPRATVRMSNLALGLSMQQQLDSEILLHVCCRDRNLLGQQAFLLGAHVLGIRNLVVITGDPPKMGDYPDATAVYDQDSIGLLHMCSGFNAGVDPAGRATQEQTQFVLATGVEPAAEDFEREMVRLRQKIKAGANLIMTQPIYAPEHMERFLDAASDLKVPVLVGVLPLASARNAQFIHHNIPGMQIPKAVRQRLAAAKTGVQARQIGTKIAIESLLGVRDRVAGAYLMPPLGRYEMAADIIQALGTDRSLSAQVQNQLDNQS